MCSRWDGMETHDDIVEFACIFLSIPCSDVIFSKRYNTRCVYYISTVSTTSTFTDHRVPRNATSQPRSFKHSASASRTKSSPTDQQPPAILPPPPSPPWQLYRS
ncbi:unnamed protein product [Ascophyllum nodosum]